MGVHPCTPKFGAVFRPQNCPPKLEPKWSCMVQFGVCVAEGSQGRNCCHFLSFSVIFCHFLSFPVISCHFLSFSVISIIFCQFVRIRIAVRFLCRDNSIHSPPPPPDTHPPTPTLRPPPPDPHPRRFFWRCLRILYSFPLVVDTISLQLVRF